MKHGILEIDHLLTYVADLGRAAQSYERLGFTLSPVSHITSMGIANRLVLLHAPTAGAGNFIELMGVADAAALPEAMRAPLSGAQGIKSMVLATPDAGQAYRQLSEAGYGFAPPSHVKREWALPGEASVWPEFDVLLPIPAPLSFNLCQYYNLELYQRESWRRHPNTATSLLAAFAVGDAPARQAAYFEQLFGARSRSMPDGGVAVSPAAVDLILYGPDDFAARFGQLPQGWDGSGLGYAGYRIGVADLAALRACLQGNGVPCAGEADRVVVGPGHACGNVVEFVAWRP